MRSRKTLCMHVELPSSYLAVLESLVAKTLGGREGGIVVPLPLQEYEDRGNMLVRWLDSANSIGETMATLREARNTDGGEAAKKRWQKAFRFITNGQSIKRQPPREFNEWKQLSRWH